MPIQQTPLGHGRIVWLGINQERGTFSHSRDMVTIGKEGIVGDIYCTMWRRIAGHDGDYIATDGVVKGDEVLNLRQITIVDAGEVRAAGEEVNTVFEPGMLRENIVVDFAPIARKPLYCFSKLPPLSRMVIGDVDPKVLILTEQNGPCRTIARPIARHLGHPDDEVLRNSLKNRRGQMAMVRSYGQKDIHIGDSFKIFPPM